MNQGKRNSKEEEGIFGKGKKKERNEEKKEIEKNIYIVRKQS